MTRPPHLRAPAIERRATGLLAGGVLSAVVHAGALALIIGSAGGADAPPVPVLAVEVIDSRALPAGPEPGPMADSGRSAEEPLPPAAESLPIPPEPAEPADPPPVETAEAIPPEPSPIPEPPAVTAAEAPPPESVAPPDETGPVGMVEPVEPVETADAPAPPRPAPPPPARKPPPPEPAPVTAARPPDDRPPRPPAAAAPAARPAPAAATARPSAVAAAPGEPAASQGPTLGARAVSSPRPRYPMIARRRGLEGRVVLRVRVSPAGTPEAVELAESSGVDSLDDAAAEAVRRWRFSPALRDGVAVAALLDIPVRFRLDED